MKQEKTLLNFVSELKEIKSDYSDPTVSQISIVNKYLKSGWILVNVYQDDSWILATGEGAPVYIVGRINQELLEAFA